MLNENMNISKKQVNAYEPIPERSYNVELLDIIIEDKPKFRNPSETEKMLQFKFVILKGIDAKGEDLRGRIISRSYVPMYFYVSSRTGKNLLYKIVEALIGRTLRPDEEMGLDSEKFNSLIGKQCSVVIKHKPKGDKVYSNIESFFVANEEQEPLSKDEKDELLAKINKKAEPKSKEEDKEKDEEVIEFQKSLEQ